MFVAGMLALTMGVSAVAAPCAALAQEAPAQAQEQELDGRYITPDDAIQVVLNHAYDEGGLTPDRMLDLKVRDDREEKGRLMNYFVSFDVVNCGEPRVTHVYYIRATDGWIWGYGQGD